VTPADRVGPAVRAFFLAAELGLALAFAEPRTVQGAVFLAALAALAVGAARLSVAATGWLLVIEGVLAALTVGVTLPNGALLMTYLMVPPLLAGASATRRDVLLVVGGEALALTTVLAVGGASASMRVGLELAAPWAVAGVGIGLVAERITRMRGAPPREDEASYEAARRLLSQLRTVARRLSSGLDPVSMAAQALTSVHEALGDTRSALFVRTEGGVLSPLGYLGPGAQTSLRPDGTLIDECWKTAEPAQGSPNGPGESGHVVALPLRSGARMIGVVVSAGGEPADARVMQALMRDLDDQALRLDTALVFDEVRSLATMEERQRLAREIHDGVAQEIASLGYFVDDLGAGTVDDDQRRRLQRLRSEISRVVSELRLSIFDLRSEVSPASGLGSALSDYVRAVGARSGLTVHLTLDEAPIRLRDEIETELLRIAQEAITNARKHSDAHNLWVDCRIHPPFARITVEDDGRGLGSPREDSYGLTIMRERADRISASLEIGERHVDESAAGTRVIVTVGEEITSVV